MLGWARRGCWTPAPDTVATPKAHSPARGGRLLGAGDSPWPLLPLPTCHPSPSGTGGVPDLLLCCWKKERAPHTRPDLGTLSWGLCPLEGPRTTSCHGARPLHLAPRAPDGISVGWRWPIREQTHACAGCPRVRTREGLNGTSFCPSAERGRTESFTPVDLGGWSSAPPHPAGRLQSTAYSGSGAGQAAET